MTQEKMLERLNELSAKFMELKTWILKLDLKDTENLRLGIQYMDDGFLRTREAIFAVPVPQPAESANDAAVPTDEPLIAAIN